MERETQTDGERSWRDRAHICFRGWMGTFSRGAPRHSFGPYYFTCLVYLIWITEDWHNVNGQSSFSLKRSAYLMATAVRRWLFTTSDRRQAARFACAPWFFVFARTFQRSTRRPQNARRFSVSACLLITRAIIRVVVVTAPAFGDANRPWTEANRDRRLFFCLTRRADNSQY